MLQMTSIEALRTQATKNKKNQNTSAGTDSTSNDGACSGVGRSIENLSTTAKLAKSKKPNMTNFGLEFLTPKAKKIFTDLQKVLIKVLIFHYFDLERHIHIETDVLS